MATPTRLLAIDLRDLTEAEHAALRQQAIRENLSLTDLLGKLVTDASRRLVEKYSPESLEGRKA